MIPEIDLMCSIIPENLIAPMRGYAIVGAIGSSKPRTKVKGEQKNREEEWFFGQMISGRLAKSSDLATAIGSP